MNDVSARTKRTVIHLLLLVILVANSFRGSFVPPSEFFYVSIHNSDSQGKGQIDEQDSYTLIVVRCEKEMDWINDVPADWRIIVYEKCGLTTNGSSSHNAMFVDQPIENFDFEECTSYLDYIINYYGDGNLTDVNIFIHDDALRPYSQKKGSELHTPFHNFTELVNATMQLMTKDQGFLHYGVTLLEELGPWSDSYFGEAIRSLWPLFASTEMPNAPDKIFFRPSAHMAVRKERILAVPLDVYKALQRNVYYSRFVPGGSDARQMCCAMERSWHMLFGEPPIMPYNVSVYDRLNLTV